MNAIKLVKVDFDNLHFCRDNKVRYRKHLTVGMILATALGMIGVATGLVWLTHLSALANGATAIIWIWE
jgi:hypothetical protein